MYIKFDVQIFFVNIMFITMGLNRRVMIEEEKVTVIVKLR